MLPERMIKAEIAMRKVELRALELGANICKPVFEGGRYDYIVEFCGKFYRAQVKYADGKHKNTDGAVQVNLRKQIRKNRNCPYHDDEIDALLIYVPKIDKICWFGPEIFHGKQNLSIRITPTKSGRVKGCVALDNFVW